MAIRMTTAEDAIVSYMQRVQQHIKKAILSALGQLGNECVEKIRERPAQESWVNRSGNLRSSIEFGAYDKGVLVLSSNFTVVMNGTKGATNAKKMIAELANEYAKVFSMAVVAAMDYASDVEAIESKDVLESARIWASSVIEKRIKAAIEEALEEINKWKL